MILNRISVEEEMQLN